MNRSLALAALLTLGCTTPPGAPDYEFCAETRVADTLARAAARWDSALGIASEVDDVCDPWETPVLVRKLSECETGGDPCPCGRSLSDRILIDTHLLELEPLLVHELGHWYSGRGDHLTEGPGIMRAKGDGPGLTITSGDVEYVCRKLHCREMRPEAL